MPQECARCKTQPKYSAFQYVPTVTLRLLHQLPQSLDFRQMATHEQVWVKVNTQVDAALADIVSLLNRVDGLQTLQSCQGDKGDHPAYIYFSFGDWRNLCQFAFDRLGPKLREKVGEDARLSVEVVDGSQPIGKMSFSAEAIPHITSALKEVVTV